MIEFIPRPIRDIVQAPFLIRGVVNAMKSQEPGSAGAAIVGMFGGGTFTLPPAQLMIKAACRTALAAGGCFALFASHASPPIAAVVASVISLPSLIIAGSAYAMYYGTASVIASLSSGSFQTLGIGLSGIVGGWFALEYHDYLPLGLVEPIIHKIADKGAASIVRTCTKSL